MKHQKGRYDNLKVVHDQRRWQCKFSGSNSTDTLGRAPGPNLVTRQEVTSRLNLVNAINDEPRVSGDLPLTVALIWLVTDIKNFCWLNFRIRTWWVAKYSVVNWLWTYPKTNPEQALQKEKVNASRKILSPQ